MRYARRTTLALLAAGAVALTASACSGAPDSDGRATASGATSADDSPARLATAEFRVEGMTCGGCALATEMSVKKLAGVASVDAEYDRAAGEGRCSVEYDPAVLTTDAIAAAIERAGFTPTLRDADHEG